MSSPDLFDWRQLEPSKDLALVEMEKQTICHQNSSSGEKQLQFFSQDVQFKVAQLTCKQLGGNIFSVYQDDLMAEFKGKVVNFNSSKPHMSFWQPYMMVPNSLSEKWIHVDTEEEGRS